LTFTDFEPFSRQSAKRRGNGEQIDEILFFDTSWEWPQMYDHIARVEEKNGRGITKICPEKDFNYFAFERLPERTKRTLTIMNYELWVRCKHKAPTR